MAQTLPPHSLIPDRLGEGTIVSPIKLSRKLGDARADYVKDDERVLYSIEFSAQQIELSAQPSLKPGWGEESLEKAGPREHIFFDPTSVHAAIVTCGGLCPGLNDVIRSLVMTLWSHYGVQKITGFRYGYLGLIANSPYAPMSLNPTVVDSIHRHGGTILGSARGGGDRTSEIIDSLVQHGVNMLFCIGGDGTQKAALRLKEEIEKRGLLISVVGVPKTIDNDLSFVERSFGFETAVTEAVRAVDGAHNEAIGAPRGIGLVKLMGRESGFIAAHAALASNEADFVLIPEVPFELEGNNGLFAHLSKRIKSQGHAVIVVAEGAGQNFVEGQGTDAGGNKKFGDIGLFLQQEIINHFRQLKEDVSLKYLDPSYSIRALAANPSDSIYCARLGSNAVHAAMSGRTGCIVGMVNNRLVHVPIKAACSKRNSINPDGPLWRDVLFNTRMPLHMTSAED